MLPYKAAVNPLNPGGHELICKRCGSSNVFVTPVAEQRPRGCLLTLLYIILLCIPIVGWIALFFLIRGRRSKTVTYAVCQSCGERKKL
jgi:hypothetical protein